MRITKIHAYPISFAVPPHLQVSLGIGRTIKRDAVIVKVETDAGITGWGEAHAARAPTVIAELINTTLAQLVTGLAIRRPDAEQPEASRQGHPQPGPHDYFCPSSRRTRPMTPEMRSQFSVSRTSCFDPLLVML